MRERGWDGGQREKKKFRGEEGKAEEGGGRHATWMV